MGVRRYRAEGYQPPPQAHESTRPEARPDGGRRTFGIQERHECGQFQSQRVIGRRLTDLIHDLDEGRWAKPRWPQSAA